MSVQSAVYCNNGWAMLFNQMQSMSCYVRDWPPLLSDAVCPLALPCPAIPPPLSPASSHHTPFKHLLLEDYLEYLLVYSACRLARDVYLLSA